MLFTGRKTMWAAQPVLRAGQAMTFHSLVPRMKRGVQTVLSAIIVVAVPLPTVGSVRMGVKERPRADAWLP